MRLVTMNLWGRSGPWRARYRWAARELAALRPDIVCLQEVDDRTALLGLARACRLEIAVADLAVSMLAILTRGRPPAELIELDARSPREGVARRLCAVDLDGVTVATTHLSWRADDRDARRGQAAQIARHLAAPAVVCGDFNCELDAPELAPLTARFSDTLAGTPAASRPTWDNRNPHTAPYRNQYPDLRIDLVLADPALLARYPPRQTAIVLDTPDPRGIYPSDHFGVLVDLPISLTF